MKKNFIEFIFNYFTLEILIALIVYKLLTSTLDDIAFPLILGKQETLNIQKFIEQLIFTTILLISTYIISISI